MPIRPQILVSKQVAGTGATSIYTAPAGSVVTLGQGTIANVSGSAVTVGLSLVPSGGSDDGTHNIIPSTYSLAAGDALPLEDFGMPGMFMTGGDFLSINCGTGAAIDVVITGTVQN